MKIGFWNPWSYSNERHEYCKSLNYDILGLTELHNKQNIKEEIDLYNLCENTDSKGEKFWLEGIRKTGKERGVGTLTYIKTSEKYKQFLNKKCNYGVSWFNQDSFFLKQKCKL